MSTEIFPLFSVYGIELEYMIVDQKTLNILPIADEILKDANGIVSNEIELGEIGMSNELTCHVIELKTNGPKANLNTLPNLFAEQVQALNKRLSTSHAMLMPTGAHPWLKTSDSIKLWPHGDRTIYEAYNRIFNCSGHGWSNLQSTHINLPFANDDEFCQLHNAIRLVLPIIPALAASTPFIEQQRTGVLDSRLVYYGKNQQMIPCIAGDIIPEFITNRADYQAHILQPMYHAIAELDREKILQYEWLNSRGAISRFDRSAIEIRIMDIQECPLADIACISAITGAIRFVIANTEAYLQSPLDCKTLRKIYEGCIQQGFSHRISEKAYLQQLGWQKMSTPTAKQLWDHLCLVGSTYINSQSQSTLEQILKHGALAERMLHTYNAIASSSTAMNELYYKLCDALNQNRLYIP